MIVNQLWYVASFMGGLLCGYMIVLGVQAKGFGGGR